MQGPLDELDQRGFCGRFGGGVHNHSSGKRNRAAERRLVHGVHQGLCATTLPHLPRLLQLGLGRSEGIQGAEVQHGEPVLRQRDGQERDPHLAQVRPAAATGIQQLLRTVGASGRHSELGRGEEPLHRHGDLGLHLLRRSVLAHPRARVDAAVRDHVQGRADQVPARGKRLQPERRHPVPAVPNPAHQCGAGKKREPEQTRCHEQRRLRKESYKLQE
mmetsp:Transcript_11316/g.25173  ORF Transcript_11316/g.25173 Transcript_11316/m.25173 type:complete len:217 (-) Transcript_11316:2083-2733(-)